MERREFCRLATAAAVASAIPVPAQSRAASPTARPLGEVASGFNSLTEDYASLCAKPAEQRTFYQLSGSNIVKVKLNPEDWHPTGYGKAPELPIAGGSWDGVPMDAPVFGLSGTGPYRATWDSLLHYEVPEWYRDAKFGIWAHWSPQCVPEAGDWYARKMYMEKEPDYKYQIEHYGHPSKFGYKDLCAQWTLLNWNPDDLIARYKKAGARLFLALANHHGSFDTWSSKHQPWNAAAVGPHQDVVGTWAASARKQGLRFGVTVHQARNWWWLQTSHGADQTGALEGLPYDGDLTTARGEHQWWQGLDPQMLYSVKHPYDALPDASYVKNFYDRTRDLIDQHDPDLLYFDNARLPLGWGGMNIGAYYYNNNLKTHGGRMEAVMNGKFIPDSLCKALVADYERGLTSKIQEYPWQSETCIGNWHYKRSLYDQPGPYGGYLPPRDAILWLVDTVSKNGTFILNIPGKPDGTIDSKEIAVLDGITSWIQANGEAIYETRPWKVFGEGPNEVESGSFHGNSIKNLGPQDIRFTRNKANTVVYAIVLGWPSTPVMIRSLGTSAASNPGKIDNVTLIGCDQELIWKQTADGLRIQFPTGHKPLNDYAASLRVTLS